MNTIKKKKSRKIKKKLIKILQRCSAIKIQCAFRKYRTHWINKDYESRNYNENDKFYNTTTLLGRNKDEIEKMFFYKNNNYFFDIRELNRHISNSNKHPYTNLIMREKTIRQIKRIIFNLRKYDENYIEINEEDSLSNINMITSLKTDLFLKIDKYIGVSNINNFNKLDEYGLFNYIEEWFMCNLISTFFDEDDILYTIHNLYIKWYNEKKDYNNNDYNKKMLEHRFNFHYYILNFLHKVIDIQDQNQITRALILNENI